MIDTLAIVLSTLGVLFVVVRASRLDRKRPWFPPPGSSAEQRERGPAVLRQGRGRA